MSPPALQYATTTFDKGVARLTDLIVGASLGVTLPIELSIPGDDVVAPTTVDLVFAAQCMPGYVVSTTAQRNQICTACEVSTYEHNEECHTCRNGMVCQVEGLSLNSVSLARGYWRTDDDSYDIHKCRFGTTSCPGADSNNQATGRRLAETTTVVHPYCSDAHVGHLCSACAPDYFLSWTGDGECYECATKESHAPTIGLMSGVFVFVVSCLVCAYKTSLKRDITTATPKPTNSLLSKAKEVYTLAKFKVFTLFLTSQVWLRSHSSR